MNFGEQIPSRRFAHLLVNPYVWLSLLLVTAIALAFFNLSTASQIVLFRTILLGVAASCIAIPLGSLASWICLTKSWISQALMIAVMALLLLPMIIHVSGWDAAFGKLGWLTSARGQVLEPLVSGWTAAIWIHGIAATPQVALILMVFAWNDGREFEEQAYMDATKAQVFCRLTLPRYIPILIVSSLWVIVSCAREISVTDLYQVGTMAEQVYLGYSLNSNSMVGVWSSNDLAEASNIDQRLTLFSIGLLVLTASLVFMYLMSMSSKTSDRADRIYNQSQPSTGLQKLLGLGLLIVLVLVPVANTIARASFHIASIDGVAEQRYSLARLPDAISKSVNDYQEEIIWSCLISAAAACVILLISILWSSIGRASGLGRAGFITALAVCLALPGPVIGNVLAGLFTSIDQTFFNWLIDYTIFGPVMASVIYCWPVGAVLVWFLFQRTPTDTLESAKLDGAGFWRRLWVFGIQANTIAICGCWLLSFALCFGELAASQMVRPAGLDTVARKMLGDLHAGVDELTAGITIVMTLAVVGVSLLGWYFIWLNQTDKRRK